MKLIQGSYTSGEMTGEVTYGFIFRQAEDREQKPVMKVQLGTLYQSTPLHVAVDSMLTRLKEFQWVADAIIAAAEQQP